MSSHDGRQRERSRSRERDVPTGISQQQQSYSNPGGIPPTLPYGVPNLPSLPAFATVNVSFGMKIVY